MPDVSGNILMNRDNNLRVMATVPEWDIVIIGGGSSGLGAAVDAASRGYKTLLLEQADFAKGTSSRSTKLIHGGVRYLAQGNIKLVYDALEERGCLLKNAPHIVKKQLFVIPCYSWFSVLKYYAGLTLYDWLAGRLSFGRSKYLSRKKLLQTIPDLQPANLAGGVEYCDGQFDDARLAVNLAQTCAELGGTVINYVQVTGLLKGSAGNVNGVIAADTEKGTSYHIRSKAVINATGVFADGILGMDTPLGKPVIGPSQGVHIVLPATFLNSASAVMIPETSDGRVLFAIPWHHHLLVGTTDTPVPDSSLEPRALESEIDFIITTSRQYLTGLPERKDVLSVFAGLRPLAAMADNTNSTKEISRSHQLMVSRSGLVTVIGGKWTTYRKMAEDMVNKAVRAGRLPVVKCNTKQTKIHGHATENAGGYLGVYGSDAADIQALVMANPALGQKLVAYMPYTHAQVVWAVRNEMARTVEDVIARRLRVLFLDAKAAMEIAPQVAALMAAELEYDKSWEDEQVSCFNTLASQYLPASFKAVPLTPAPVTS